MPAARTTIRHATANDAQAIAEIMRDVGWFEAFNVKPLEELTAAVERYIYACAQNGSTFIVAENQERVVGVAVVEWRATIASGCEGYLSQLYVHSDARGQGIGNRLITAIKAEAKNRDCHKLMAYISRKRSTYAREFYPKTGWIEREDAALFFMTLT